jgi:hemolysin activation/secretion protein
VFSPLFLWRGLALLGSLCVAPAVAQTPPDAGALRQHIEQFREPALPRQLTPAQPPEPAALAPQTTLRVTVRTFRLQGNRLIATQTLQDALASYLNRPLDYAQLENAAAVVAEVYRSAGWVVRAYLPEQDLQDGVVTIQVVEALFGGTTLEGSPPLRVRLAQIQAILDAHQKVDEVLNASALDRALLVADDLPGVAVAGSLREGAQSGQTELLLRLTDEPLLSATVQLDNHGNRSTGSNRLGADANLNSLLQQGDLLSANALVAEGSEYLRLGATVPVGAQGWRLGAHVSRLGYRLLLAEFAALHASGSSDSYGLEASYPMLRTRLRNLSLNANADHTHYDNQANGSSSSRYATDSLSLGLSGNQLDNFWGGGASNANLTLSLGQLDLAGSPSQAADAAGSRAEGGFGKLRYGASRQQVLLQELSLYAALSGQWTERNLDSSEKFYLGGANGVRAYPANEGGGALGQLLNLELRWRLPQGLSLSGFYDLGLVTVNPDSNFVGAATLNHYRLEGHGLALVWQSSTGLTLKASWARRIGQHPAPSANGRDQDGSQELDRWWFSASLPF